MLTDQLTVPLDLKADDDQKGVIEGYGAVFGNIDRGRDIIAAGAFQKSLKARRPALLWQHDRSRPIGVWDEVVEDAHGLKMKGRLLLQGKGLEAYELLKIGAMNGLSIGFQTKKDQWDRIKEVRTILEADLFEVSLVTFPMNEKARIRRVKSADDIETIRDLEKTLRDAGMSKEQARKAASRFVSKGDIERRDAAEMLAKLKADFLRNIKSMKS